MRHVESISNVMVAMQTVQGVIVNTMEAAFAEFPIKSHYLP